jgi:mono/diheme cytochrome c family protein
MSKSPSGHPGEITSVPGKNSACSLPPCGGGLGRGVVLVARARPKISTPPPNPTPQGGGEPAEYVAPLCVKLVRVPVNALACAALALGLGALAVVELAAAPKPKPSAQAQPAPAAPQRLGIGRAATAAEVAGWDIDIRPDGHGLPAGKGSAKQGEPLYLERCAACHGEFGESSGRWPIIMGGAGSLASHDPVKSVGSYWPFASTLFDYIRRTMPFGNAQSLSNDELYAVTAYVLWLNDVIKDENFELSASNFTSIKLPNEANFRDDDREVAEKEFWREAPCMANCAPGEAAIIGRARALEVTPDSATAPKVE